MTLFDKKCTNIYGDGEVAGRTPDAEGDYYHITDGQEDHDYWQSKFCDVAQALSGDPAADYMILFGGVVSDSGSGQIDISECVAKGLDSLGNKRLTHIPALTNVALPSGWNNNRQIWVVAKYDFKLGSSTRAHRAGTSYHYQIEDTYYGDSNGDASTSTDDLFVDADPTGTAVVLGSFKMNGTTFANMNVRSGELVKSSDLNGKTYANLLVKRNVGSANTKVDISWTGLYLGWMKTGAQSFTLDITASGLLGLDTGTESADAWYYIWIIAKVDGTVSAILSLSDSAPTMPAGYTLKRLVSMVRNTSGNFVDFIQKNEQWLYSNRATIKSVSSFISEVLNCDVYIPSGVNRAKVSLELAVIDTATPSEGVLYLYDDIYGIYPIAVSGYAISPIAGVYGKTVISGVLYLTSRYIRYSTIDSISATSVATTLFISGFEVPL